MARLTALPKLTPPREGALLKTPVLVVGGSTAAYSATLTLLKLGHSVVWVQPYKVIGGQYTTQAVAAAAAADLAESREKYVISRWQRAFRQRRRSLQPVAGKTMTNPGGAWGSSLATTPVVAATALQIAIAPYLDTQQLQLIANSTPDAVLKQEIPGQRRQVVGVQFRDRLSGHPFTVMAPIIIEATDLGDLLALGDLESRIGQESVSETGEAALPETAYPQCQQPFTWGAVVALTAPGQGDVIAAPSGTDLDSWLKTEEFTADVWTHGPHDRWKRWDFLSPLGLFRYGRIVRSHPVERRVQPGDVAVIAWGTAQSPDNQARYGNDYRFGTLVGVPISDREQHLQQARDRTRAYLQFLQTQATPDLKLRADLALSDDGFAIAPYIREARRGVALKTIRHEEVAAQFFDTPRATCFPDAVGIGEAACIDLRQNQESGHIQLKGQAAQVRPFSLPARALVPIATDGLILSSKSIGTTHITNAVYRLPTVEWAIGEASGFLAAFAIARGQQPRDIVHNIALLRQLQGHMTRQGIPIFRFDDVAHDDPDFEPIQMMAVMNVLGSHPQDSLRFCPEASPHRALVATTLVTLLDLVTMTPVVPTFQDVLPGKHSAYAAIETLYSSGIADGISGDRFAPHRSIRRSTFATWIRRAVPDRYARAFRDTPTHGGVLRRRELARVLYAIATDFSHASAGKRM
ncbi:MAG: FAD-dependent oxidoreductase [Leptolyngbya sp. SIO1E4]|nr:FAD-dependent oxidoreductase [Leptolyngbya sp. SIO1E4]